MKRIMKALGKCHPSNCPTDRQASIARIVILLVVLLIIFLVCGCSGSGFDKRATLMPDSVSLSVGQERYKGDSDAWRGGSISATWEFE